MSSHRRLNCLNELSLSLILLAVAKWESSSVVSLSVLVEDWEGFDGETNDNFVCCPPSCFLAGDFAVDNFICFLAGDLPPFDAKSTKQ